MRTDIYQTEHVAIPLLRYEELLRAETERDLLEAALSSEHKWKAEDFLQSMQEARYRLREQEAVVLTEAPDINAMINGEATGEIHAE